MSVAGVISYLESERNQVVDSSEGYIRTRHQIGDSSLEILGNLEGAFPHSLPEYFLCERSSYGRLAHVGWPRTLVQKNEEKFSDLGLICGGSSDALALDSHSPEKVYLAGLNKAIATFKPAFLDPDLNEKECLREFVGHWQFAVTDQPILLVGESSKTITDLHCTRPKSKSQNLLSKPIALLEELDSQSQNYLPRIEAESKDRRTSGKGLLINLNGLIAPPSHTDDLKQWWRHFLQVQTHEEKKELRNKARHTRSTEFWIVCRTRYEDQDIWFALIANSINKEKAPIALDFLDNWSFSARTVDPHTRDYLIPRGGGTAQLQEKSALVVGCGSVGSVIASSLASSGIGKLALADHDVFSLDNLYRHSLLSMRWDGILKAPAITTELGQKFPFTRLEHSKSKLLGLTDSQLKSFDLIIVAIGNSTHEFAFNEKLILRGIKTPVVYTWLEPNGIGGHAVLVGGNYENGCHQCNFLIPGGEGERSLTPNLNFLKPNQNVTEHVGSCGSLFLPYSILDASQTANMATKLAIRALLEKTKLGKKVSWRGNLVHEELPNLKFTDRYFQFESQLKEIPTKNQLCALCSK